MSVTSETYEVLCFVCGEVFASWDDPMSGPETSLVCPRCGHDLAADPAFHEDGALSALSDEERDER